MDSSTRTHGGLNEISQHLVDYTTKSIVTIFCFLLRPTLSRRRRSKTKCVAFCSILEIVSNSTCPVSSNFLLYSYSVYPLLHFVVYFIWLVCGFVVVGFFLLFQLRKRNITSLFFSISLYNKYLYFGLLIFSHLFFRDCYIFMQVYTFDISLLVFPLRKEHIRSSSIVQLRGFQK